MSPQVLVLVGCVLIAAALVLAVVAVATVPPVDRSKAVANLRRGQPIEVAVAAPRKRSAAEGSLVARLVPAAAVALLDRQHQRAGRPASFVLSRLLLGKAVWPFAAIAIIVLVAMRGESLLTLIALAVAVVGYFVPDLLLLSRGQERDQAIQKALPDTLDQMLIGVDAGLGFDAAMSRTAANGSGPLSEELTRTLQDVRMGRSRREAFEQLVERTKVADLRQFVRAILQADAYGISVTEVLRTQAAEMRRRRRQRAEEQAQKVPVMVLMPLMLCILPVLFIVVLGPAAFGIVEAFSGM